MTEHPYGWWSLLPPIVAIVLAIATRRVVVSLLIGVVIGALVLTYGNPRAALPMALEDYLWLILLPAIVAIVLAIATRRIVVSLLIGAVIGVVIGALVLTYGSPRAALPMALEDYLWKNLADEDHLRVFVFTSLMGAMVGVVFRAGGMHGIVAVLAPLARSRRGGQLMTWLLGLVVFFDDYANTLLLGGTMRPLADRLKISREKLAYLVDSTAAPVAGLAIISTWVAGEIGYIEDGYAELLTVQVNGMDIFIQTIPYRFYVLFALLFVPIVALLGRDFGPMLTAERNSQHSPDEPIESSMSGKAWQLNGPPRWFNAAIPVLLMIGVTIWLLHQTGYAAIIKPAIEKGVRPPSPTFFESFSQGNSYVALVYGALAGLLSAMLLALAQRLLDAKQIASAAREGVGHVVPALAILWMAWSLSSITKATETAQFLGGLLEQGLPIWLMPTMVFILASAVAFATGTSWGTMGILTPLAVRVTYEMLANESAAVSPTDPILIAAIGSVLAGAIFGDHCSPISDTTVLSSQASGCDHVAHVWTQMPYALLVAGVSIVCGTIPVGLGISVWVCLPVGVVVLIVCLLLLGEQDVDDAPLEKVVSK